jgi:hypothetical protein
MGWIVLLPQGYIEILAFGNCECDLIWNCCPRKFNQVKMKSLVWAKPNMAGVLIRRWHVYTQRHTTIWWQRHKWEWFIYKPKNAKEGQGTNRRGKEKFSPTWFRENMVLSTYWFQTCRLQNCKTINSCYLTPCGLWYFIMQPQETNATMRGCSMTEQQVCAEPRCRSLTGSSRKR